LEKILPNEGPVKDILTIIEAGYASPSKKTWGNLITNPLICVFTKTVKYIEQSIVSPLLLLYCLQNQ